MDSNTFLGWNHAVNKLRQDSNKQPFVSRKIPATHAAVFVSADLPVINWFLSRCRMEKIFRQVVQGQMKKVHIAATLALGHAALWNENHFIVFPVHNDWGRRLTIWLMATHPADGATIANYILILISLIVLVLWKLILIRYEIWSKMYFFSCECQTVGGCCRP